MEKKEDGTVVDHFVSKNMRGTIPNYTQVDEITRMLGEAEYEKQVQRDELER